jgi:hypothetical protein
MKRGPIFKIIIMYKSFKHYHKMCENSEFSLEQATKVQMGSWSIAMLFP